MWEDNVKKFIKERAEFRRKAEADRVGIRLRLAARDREYARSFPANAYGCRRGVIPAGPRGSGGLHAPLDVALYVPNGCFGRRAKITR